MALLLGLGLMVLILVGGTDGRCERSATLDHGTISNRNRNFVRFRCDYGYALQGSSISTCGSDGRLRGERPFCAKRGCPEPDSEGNRYSFTNNGLKAYTVCNDGYVLVGSRNAYCNGTHWNTELGTCRRSNHAMDHSCDFESEDQCGWSAEQTFMQPWKRISTVADHHSFRTGPRHDHTFQNSYGGHYMLMETKSGAFGSYHFMSPIYPRELSLKTACCFRFHYLMYGAGVDNLVVSVKPISLPVQDMWSTYRDNSTKWKMTGSQGTQWLEHTIFIDEMEEDFQVIFTATDARSRLGDIAIDDVRLMTGRDCGVGEYTTTTEPTVTPDRSDEPMVFDMANCTNRCGRPATPFVFTGNGILIGCGCNEDCVEQQNCCLNYFEECVAMTDDTTPEEVVTTTTTTTTRRPTTTTTTTTTTPKPTTKRTTTTTTTTTPKPTTKRTTTTTTTTPKPTTRTTTRRTTTRKPTTTTTKRTTTTRRLTTTTKRTTTTQKTTTTTTPKTTTTATTPKTTTIAPTTTTSTTTSTQKSTSAAVNPPQGNPVSTTERINSRISWTVDPNAIAGNMDITGNSAANPALIMLYILLAIVLIVGVGNVTYRWIIPMTASAPGNEKAVAFQKAFSKVRKTRLLRRNQQKDGQGQPLCDTDDEDGDDYFENDATRFEEMGVDIRNVTDL
ncbi:uncharacterized protein LOC108163636 [Drosophila miranda]|uniref:uncharacterized protein LOC108163636 n=1 Tax=Drosophila miranda TaxID=7229 RepID=UPI0007E69877|nr:uncharacterized protein LOC108163636 [Drosophila miranda]